MQTATNPTDLAMMAGVLGLAFGAVTTLGKWGIQSLQTARKDGKPNPTNGGGFRSVDGARLEDTKKLAVDTNNRVREVGQTMETTGVQGLQEARRQTEVMGKVVDGVTNLRTDFAILAEKLSKD